MIQQSWLKGHVPCPEKQPQTCCTWTLIFSEDQKPNHDNEQPLASNRARWPDRQRAKTENPLPFRKIIPILGVTRLTAMLIFGGNTMSKVFVLLN